MTELKAFLDRYINEDLEGIFVSNARKKGVVSKIQVRPVLLKGQLKYQTARTEGQKVLHENMDKEALISYLLAQMQENFKQLQIEGKAISGTILVNKKGKAAMKIKEKKEKSSKEPVRMLSHNRIKQYLLKEGSPIPWLVDLGVMDQEGRVKHAKYDKFRQLNRFLELIEDILPKLPKDRELRILDFGCGKSYLTFAMYYYLKEVKGYAIQVIGLDLKADVIQTCSRLAEKYGFEHLHFQQGDIASYEGAEVADMVVTLHACDTATDYALAKAVQWGASVILSVPCCQHELNRQVKNQTLAPVLEYGILKERFAALLTDGLRAQMLESMGYETQVLEFIDMEHTPKNLLIRAVKNENRKNKTQQKEAWEACAEAFQVHPTLQRLLFDPIDRKDYR